jgi:isoquinoline 1-oxidoreductase beta subunit
MRNDWINGIHNVGADLSRRGFLKAAGVVGGGLVLGFFVPGANKLARAADAKKAITPNAFVRIAPDDTITVAINRLEFGQGVSTSLPMLIAEELDADWSQMRFELAPAGAIFVDPVFGIQMTGGSLSIKNSYIQYREIGAAARAMLIAAAAKQWQVTVQECRAENSMVFGPLGYKASFGSLAEAAMQQPVPDLVELKKPAQFKFIGKPVLRIDAQA